MTAHEELAGGEMAGGWNIFARVLAGLLAKRGYGLTDLYHAGIYREEVRRLRRSLQKPGTFPVLNPTELQRISARYTLTPAEIWSLRAAVLATAVQRLLYGRIPAEDARLAAQEIFPLLIEAIGQTRVSPVWRHELDDNAPPDQSTPQVQRAGSAASGEDDLELPAELASTAEEILDNLDEGALALSLSMASQPVRERIHWARIALNAFTAAHAALLKLPSNPNTDEIIASWEQEAQNGRQISSDRLAEFID